MIKITKCKDCGYRALNMIELSECSKCGGELEIIASEVLKEVKDKR